MTISIISAIGKNNEIGKKNELLWNLPADMKHFKETTLGKTVVMGQKTFDSIGRPLPNRRNIVITLDKNYTHEGIETVHSLEELDELLEKTVKPEEPAHNASPARKDSRSDSGRQSDAGGEIFIIGGGQIYKLFIDKADKLYITHVEAEFPDADTFFPEIDKSKWKKVKIKKHHRDASNIYDLEFTEYERK